MLNTPVTHHLILPSQLDAVDPALEQVLSEFEAAGLSSKSKFGMQMALHEALINAVKHGNRLDPRKTVSLRWSISIPKFTVTITDEGPGFNPDDVPDPTDPAHLDRPHGRGLLLMRAYADLVEFNKSGNSVTLHFPRSAA